MKKYNYTGTSNLSFSFEGKDYMIYGTGPHSLPETSPVVQSNITLGKLVLLAENNEGNINSKK